VATRYFTHKLVNHDGAHIELPPWSALTGADKGHLSRPDVYAASHATQMYPIETVFRDGGRTFVYGKYASTVNSARTAGYNVCTGATFKDLANAGISGAAGANTVVINYGAACAVNKYAGGYLGMKGANYRSFRIISNTVQDASNYVTFTLDGTLINAITTASDDFVLMENPYADMRWYITIDSRPYIGATVSTMVASYYAWIQTWGVHMMMSAYNTWEGAAGNQAGVVAHHGSTQGFPDPTSSVIGGTSVYGASQPIGMFAAGSDPASPADVSIAYPIYLMYRP